MSNAARTGTAERAELAEIRNGLFSVFTLTAEHAEIPIALPAVLTSTAEHVELAETHKGFFSAISAASAVFFVTGPC